MEPMRRILLLVATALLALSLVACENSNDDSMYATNASDFEMSASGDMKIILNGRELDVYTMHYGATEEYANIPLTAFLQSIGAEYADSPLVEYGKECYFFMGNRYAVVPDMHLFMLEDDYWELLEKLTLEGKTLSRTTTVDCGLLPVSESKIPRDTGTYWAEILVDHISLMNALRESGVDIRIEYDYPSRIIDVSLNRSEGEN